MWRYTVVAGVDVGGLSENLEHALQEGWEPFAVTGGPFRYDIHLKKWEQV